MKFIDLTGQRFGKLVVLERADNIGRQTAWLCRCDCGNTKITSGWNLKSGQCKSCGCIAKEVDKNHSETHGKSYTRLYSIWIGMKQRCYYPKHIHFERYGGRGIKICNEWENDFEAFYEWAIANGYSDDLSIDRIDVNRNYEPGNCRWCDYIKQNNNTTRSRLLELNGEKHTVGEWSRITGIPNSTIHNRIKKGATIEKVLEKRS